MFREIATPFFVGLGLFFAVVSFAQVLKVSDSATGVGIGGGDIFQALLYSLPPLMGLLIPVSGLFATLLGVGRLAADREVVGLCASGMSPYTLLRVPLALGVVLSLCSGFALIWGEPWGMSGLRDLMKRSAQQSLARGVRVGEFNQWIPGVTFLALGRQGRQLTNVVFADRRDPLRPAVISARSGVVEHGSDSADIVFHLRDGSILARGQGSENDRVIYFDTSLYRLDVGGLVRRKARSISAAQGKSLRNLWRDSRDPSVDPERRALFLITLHRKLAIPLATIIFALLAVPLACQRSVGARARGFLYSSAIVGLYYYIGRAVELAARGGRFDPLLAAWLPNIVGLLGLAVMLVRFRRTAS